MNINALKISLNSLIQNGQRITEGKIDDFFIREYIDLYNRTKQYLSTYLDQYEVLKEPYKKFPKIEYKTFRNPYYLLKSFLLEKVRWQYKSSGGARINELFEVNAYPARTKYLDELTTNIFNINKIIEELIEYLNNRK
jgi:hypothetical protein